jgi:hypothetical protein
VKPIDKKGQKIFFSCNKKYFHGKSAFVIVAPDNISRFAFNLETDGLKGEGFSVARH